MAKSMIDSDLQRYALLGAEARLQQLQEETANIYRTFPQLRTRNGSVGTSTPSESDGPATKRRRGRMSAAQRKAVGERMKMYWASRRGQKEEATGGPKVPSARRGRRRMSAAARKRIAEAQRRRWAELKAKHATTGEAGASTQSPAAGSSRKKR